MKLSIGSKLWITIIIVVLVSSIFNYWTTLFLYQHFYVEQEVQHLEEITSKITELYNGKNITQEFKDKVDEINIFSVEGIVVADNLSKLGSCLPIKMETSDVLTQVQRSQLETGNTITIIGSHTECNQDIIVVASPLIDHDGNFDGVIFIYTTLAKITEVISQIKVLLLVYTLIFLVIGALAGKIITNKITKPLRQMDVSAKRMIEGDFNAKVEVSSEDEVGRLGKSFNHLSDSLKKTIELLSKEKKQLSQILDGISDSVLTIYLEDNFILCNGPARNLFRKFGLTKDNFINLPEVKDLLEVVSKDKEVIIDEIQFRNQSFLLYIGPLIEENHLWGIVVVVHDLTKERKRESDAREFLSIVSHELRTPLSYVKGYTEALMDGVAETMEVQERYLKTIHHETERMERLVNDYLDLAQLEKGTYPINKEEIFLNHIIEQIVERYQESYTEKGVQLNLSIEDEIWILGDEDRLIQVLVNLLDNSLRHTPKGGHVDVIAYKNEDDAIIRIADSGEGIKKEHLTKIGEGFFRVDKARNRKHGGIGLGLAIVKQIIERLDGRLEIDSVYGKGTKVTIYVPFMNKK